jgi:hypothetical protein
MKHVLFILFAIFLVLSPLRSAAQTNRVGTFNRQAIALAYYRSPLFANDLAQHRAALADARRANDTEKIRTISAWLSQSQELAHTQVFENASIPNILEALKPAFDEIEKTQHLPSVVQAPAGNSAETVDVTPQLLDWLKADSQTRSLIQDMQKQRK